MKDTNLELNTVQLTPKDFDRAANLLDEAFKVLRNQFESEIDPSGFPAILMTQRQANVRFYRRLGFEVVVDILPR